MDYVIAGANIVYKFYWSIATLCWMHDVPSLTTIFNVSICIFSVYNGYAFLNFACGIGSVVAINAPYRYSLNFVAQSSWFFRQRSTIRIQSTVYRLGMVRNKIFWPWKSFCNQFKIYFCLWNCQKRRSLWQTFSML